MLYFKGGITVSRILPEKLSNGDTNQILLLISSKYHFKTTIEVLEEVPVQFQLRDIAFNLSLDPDSTKDISYHLTPTKRGAYEFGYTNIYVQIPYLKIIKRRLTLSQKKTVPVYPSFLQLKKYDFLTLSNRLNEIGVKKVRKLGQQAEFEKIRDYVRGDDIRSINWNATARRSQLMVNQYQDEKSQQIYCIIDKGRSMKMPFEGMSLMDYAINSSLIMNNIALKHDDKTGLITFSKRVDTNLKAQKDKLQINRILKSLYCQKTDFLESDFGRLYSHTRHYITQRSLIILYTNFESQVAMERQLPYLRKIAKQHLLVVVFFQNSTLKELVKKKPLTIEEVYQQIIAEKSLMEKQQIAQTLKNFGIHTVLVEPKHLTVQSINKYLEIKAKSLI